ncbi:hypothetical protein J2W91_005630 [Paenibacillus amylolyticus]|uniref:Uncharacterized protein n=1 Tax=Paenibacillus amylolyticus TaxID=1451 RepID=A0AAP5H8D9_PAEAM|nr:hypothetical protein [Paenibacillus amylolyticus]
MAIRTYELYTEMMMRYLVLNDYWITAGCAKGLIFYDMGKIYAARFRVVTVDFAVDMARHSGSEVILLTNDRTGSEPKTQLH